VRSTQIDFLYNVCVDQNKPTRTRVRQHLGHLRSSSTYANDPDARTPQLGDAVLA